MPPPPTGRRLILVAECLAYAYSIHLIYVCHSLILLATNNNDLYYWNWIAFLWKCSAVFERPCAAVPEPVELPDVETELSRFLLGASTTVSIAVNCGTVVLDWSGRRLESNLGSVTFGMCSSSRSEWVLNGVSQRATVLEKELHLSLVFWACACDCAFLGQSFASRGPICIAKASYPQDRYNTWC